MNLGNVMIVPPLQGDFRNEYTIKIIDMGSLKNYDEALKPNKQGFTDLKRFSCNVAAVSDIDFQYSIFAAEIYNSLIDNKDQIGWIEFASS